MSPLSDHSEETAPPARAGLQDPEVPEKRNLSAVLVCVTAVIIVLMIAAFLILRPAPTGTTQNPNKIGNTAAH